MVNKREVGSVKEKEVGHWTDIEKPKIDRRKSLPRNANISRRESRALHIDTIRRP